jgi:hypothetical protein
MRTPSKSEEKLIEQIFNAATNRKYRRKALGPEAIQRIVHAITRSVIGEQPLSIKVLCGGYKHHELPSAPHADWAEVFSILHYSNYGNAIAEVAPFGVDLCWRFDHPAIVQHFVNQSEQRLSTYHNSFKAALADTKLHLGGNGLVHDGLSLSYQAASRDEDLLEFESLIQKLQVEKFQHFRALAPELQVHMLAKSARNIQLEEGTPSPCLSCTSPVPCAVTDCLLYHEAMVAADLEYYRTQLDESILIVNRPCVDNFMYCPSVGSTGIQFWVGTGVILIDSHKGTATCTIASVAQYKSLYQDTKIGDPKDYGLPAIFAEVPTKLLETGRPLVTGYQS